MKSSPRWTIGEVAERFGLAPHVLRHWEDVGLIAPDRDSAGRRRYRDTDVTRVAVIIRSKAAGMSLDQIHVLLAGQTDERREVLTAHLDDLERRMAEMARSREMTLHALECRAHDIATCPNFAAGVADLLENRTGTRPDFGSHRTATEEASR
ncbi:MerR family transcriptional regulator [Rhodococcus sp. SJ-3]|uniref:MerR family transcriptional regulator n=1 Tax=Rhodococcus sp. SJ-3 TaxID=3454628 RepID=UPI003F7AF8D6